MLTPRVGRYKYPRVQAQVKAFGEANGLDYRVTNEWELLKMNVDLYAKVATLPPVVGAKGSRPDGPKTDITRSHALPLSRVEASCAEAECAKRMSIMPARFVFLPALETRVARMRR